MKNSEYLLVLAAVSFLAEANCLAHEDAAQATSVVELTAQAHRSGNSKAVLEMELEYKGAKAIRVYQSDLPWGIQRSLLLVAICLDGKRQSIEELQPLENPSPNTLEMQVGQRLHGSVDLDDRFPKLHKCLATRDALVFWSYELTPIDGMPLRRASGVVQIHGGRK